MAVACGEPRDDHARADARPCRDADARRAGDERRREPGLAADEMRGSLGVEEHGAVGRLLDAIGERRGDVDQRATRGALGGGIAPPDDQVGRVRTSLRSRMTARTNAERARLRRGGDDACVRAGRLGEDQGLAGPIGIGTTDGGHGKIGHEEAGDAGHAVLCTGVPHG